MKLSLISCNIRFDNPADGDNSWSRRRSLLANTLLKHSPDIIATQEGRFDQLKDFGEHLGDYELIDFHRSWIKERMYPTFFLKKGKFELLKSEDLWLSKTPHMAGSLSFESAFPRLMTSVKIQPKESDVNLLVINTHLDHIKKETRAEQVRVLARSVKELWDQTSKLVIMGDFNDSPSSEVRKILCHEIPGLQDAWKIHNSVEETSHHGFTGECEGGTRIDWILVDKSIEVKSCIMEKSQINGHYPSDHFPIVCELNF